MDPDQGIIDELCQRWMLSEVDPIKNLSYSFVARVASKNGPAVLKVAAPSLRFDSEVSWYKHQQARCSPKFLEIDLRSGAMLMEQLEPGTSLSELVDHGKDAQATLVIADLISRIHVVPDDSHGFPHIRSMVGDFQAVHDFVPSPLLTYAKNIPFISLFKMAAMTSFCTAIFIMIMSCVTGIFGMSLTLMAMWDLGLLRSVP